MQTFGVFRNDGDDGDLFRNDGDDGDDGDGSRAYAGARPNSQMAQALWRTRGDLTKGFEGGIGTPVWTDQPLDKPVFGRWSRDVRAHLYSFELLSGLYFDSSSDTVGHLYSTQITPKQGESPPKFETVLESVHKLERPPFDTNKELFENELRNIMSKTGYRAERMAEILTQVTVPYSFFAMVLNLQPGRHRHTFELMSTVFRLSSTVVMQFKHHLRVRRPADRSPLVQPVLAVPGHASYPAGHATQLSSRIFQKRCCCRSKRCFAPNDSRNSK